MQSAAEAECGALYINAKEAVQIRVRLEEVGNPQPAKPMRTDGGTSDGMMNKTVEQRSNQSQWTLDSTGYKIKSNRDNLEYFGTRKDTSSRLPIKGTPTSIHRVVRPIYLYM